ncbi:centrosomal protein of 68 kDa [Polypterus senegalus]|uniref:centrosomal protein of 68 kDa n=1 Tax=Polypterus senegalus TaxID=55291 RepID=UPI001966444F|nr:centrosomal protein of 68 kDa [Polypterus senegalus]XP_039593936.1 centrosomal protein of 68 kDa [Polypterus senegalus]XP_039593937.1 centrosomal protein of 68 kDa [Polypterus senegalus]
MALKVESTFNNIVSPIDSKNFSRWSYSDMDKDGPGRVIGVKHFHNEFKNCSVTTGDHLSEESIHVTGFEKSEQQANQKMATSSLPSCIQSIQNTRYKARKPFCERVISCKEATPHVKRELFPSFRDKELIDESEYQLSSKHHHLSSKDNTKDNVTVFHEHNSPLSTNEITFLAEDLQSLHVPSNKRVSYRSLSSSHIAYNQLKPRFVPQPSLTETSSFQARIPTCQTRVGRSLPAKFYESLDFQRQIEMSPYQAEYWACAIPKTLPPTYNRQSPTWDPNEEYQALLDYTYPLKSNYTNSKIKPTRENFECEALQQDSGVELDSFSHSFSNIMRSVSTTYPENESPSNISLSLDRRSPGRTHSCHSTSADSDEPSFCTRYFVNADLPSLYFSPYSSRGIADKVEEHYTNCSYIESDHENQDDCKVSHPKYITSTPAHPQFIASCPILPLKKMWDVDDEYLSLPLTLKELETLSEQLKTISGQINKTDNTTFEQPFFEKEDTMSSFFPDSGVNAKNIWTVTSDNAAGADTQYNTIKAKDQFKPNNDFINGENKTITSKTNIFSALKGELDERPFFEGSAEMKDSLTQNIQAFCCELEQLILWLYQVAKKIDSWNPPKADPDSISFSLNEYKKFQQEIEDHEPLRLSVLKTGKLLLTCMKLTSPVLKESLKMIEKQSEALEHHTEHLYRSILTAMECVNEQQREDSDLESSSDIFIQSDLQIRSE